MNRSPAPSSGTWALDDVSVAGDETKSDGADGSTGAGDGTKNCGADGNGVTAGNVSNSGSGLLVEVIGMWDGLT